jgi:hypothetical protein
MFDIPESDIVGVQVDEESVKINKNPEYIRSRPTSSTDDLRDEHSSTSTEIETNDNKISITT